MTDHELIVTANFYGKEYQWKGAPDLKRIPKSAGGTMKTLRLQKMVR